MNETMIAKCGLVCNECDAYIATQNNDLAALQKMSEEASKQFNKTFTVEDSMCTGCLSAGIQCPYCDECAVRLCALDKGVENCAYCEDFGCETITAFIEHAPKARTNLEAIRATLN